MHSNYRPVYGFQLAQRCFPMQKSPFHIETNGIAKMPDSNAYEIRINFANHCWKASFMRNNVLTYRHQQYTERYRFNVVLCTNFSITDKLWAIFDLLISHCDTRKKRRMDDKSASRLAEIARHFFSCVLMFCGKCCHRSQKAKKLIYQIALLLNWTANTRLSYQ